MKKQLTKLFLAFTLIFLASSCKEEVVSYSVGRAYILQTDNGYIPQASLTTDNTKEPTFTMQGIEFEFDKAISNGSFAYYEISLKDTLKSMTEDLEGELFIESYNGATATIPLKFNPLDKRIGDVETTVFDYDEEKEVINIELADLVENAETYYIMYSSEISEGKFGMWNPYIRLENVSVGNLTFSQNISNKFQKGFKYRFTVGAYNGSTIRLSDELVFVSIGKE